MLDGNLKGNQHVNQLKRAFLKHEIEITLKLSNIYNAYKLGT